MDRLHNSGHCMKALTLACMALLLVGCSLQAGGLTATPLPSAEPTATAAPATTSTSAPAPMPTLRPTATAVPSPTATRGPEAYYRRLIVVDQDVQTMYVYENGVKIRQIPVSTGKPDEESTITPAWEGEVGRYVGTFFAYGTFADDAWYLFEHYGSMLIHSAPYIKQADRKSYQELDALGVRPASHGCIRLPPEESKWFTAWKPQGARVIIKPLTRQF